jgi:hypothetical protein
VDLIFAGVRRIRSLEVHFIFHQRNDVRGRQRHVFSQIQIPQFFILFLEMNIQVYIVSYPAQAALEGARVAQVSSTKVLRRKTSNLDR